MSETMEISNEQLKNISLLAKQQSDLEVEVAELTAALAKKEKALSYVSSVLLPTAMSEAQLTQFSLSSGAGITIKRSHAASISAANWPAAKKWLKENDADGVIKHLVTLTFGKGEDEKAQAALELLLEQNYSPVDKESIHPMTLKATVKEFLEKGADIPYETFGIFEVVKTVITQPK